MMATQPTRTRTRAANNFVLIWTFSESMLLTSKYTDAHSMNELQAIRLIE
jgi:hypothetical protein